MTAKAVVLEKPGGLSHFAVTGRTADLGRYLAFGEAAFAVGQEDGVLLNGTWIGVVLAENGGPVSCVAFSPDGKRIVTGSWDEGGDSRDHTARLWDGATGTELAILRGHTSGNWCLAFSPDGKLIGTASLDHTARTWDGATGAEVATLRGHTDQVHCVAFSADGERIVTGAMDNTARVWDPVTGVEVATLLGHTKGLCCVGLSPDGKRVVTGSHDSTARLWDAATGLEVAILRGHMGPVTCVAFNPDGKQILTTSAATARIWDSLPYAQRRARRQAAQATAEESRSAT